MTFWQIEVKDPENLSGNSVAEFLREIQEVNPYDTVFVFEIEGAGIGRLADVSNGVGIAVNEFLEFVREVVQFDWATFCLVRDGKSPGVSREDWIRNSLAVVRCVDDQYMYVYTSDKRIASALNAAHAQAVSIRGVSLTSLNWPS